MANDRNSVSVEELIRRYNQELMDFRQKREAVSSQQELNRKFPEPDIQRDLESLRRQQENLAVSSPTLEDAGNNNVQRETQGQSDAPPVPIENIRVEQPEPTTTDPAMSIGYLKAFVTTGRGALPVPNAQVIVTRTVEGQELLEQAYRTDISGYTPLFALPAVTGLASQTPANNAPYTFYTVYARADGFYPMRFQNVPIYGGSTSVQPIDLVPVAEGDDPEKQRTIIEGAPTNL